MSDGPGSAFGHLWAAAAVSNLGDGVALAAFPLLVASMTRDPLLVAGASVAGQLPWLLFSLPGGALADRIDRRLGMVRVDGTRAAIVALLAVLILAGQAQLWVIYVVAFALATAETVFDPASEAILPQVVSPDALPAANARLQGTTFALNSFVGPPLGAALFAVAAASPFVIDGVSFLAAALIVLTMSGSYRSAAPLRRESLLAEVRGGLRWLSAHPVLRYTAPLAGLTNLASTVILSVFVLFARDVLGVDDVGYGLLLGALGFGGLVGAMAAGAIIDTIGATAALRLPPWVGATTAAITAFAPVPIVVALSLFTVAFSIAVWNVANVSLRQQVVPDALRGRVAGANRLLATGAIPAGAALGGLTAALFGLRAPFVLAAAIFVGVGATALARITPEGIAAARRAAEAATHSPPM